MSLFSYFGKFKFGASYRGSVGPTCDKKREKCHSLVSVCVGGVRKVPKTCHILFECPLYTIKIARVTRTNKEYKKNIIIILLRRSFPRIVHRLQFHLNQHIGRTIRICAKYSQSRTHVDKFLPEGVVEPAVQERIAASGRHGDDVADDKGCVIKLPTVHRKKLQIRHQVDCVEWKPRFNLPTEMETTFKPKPTTTFE